MTKGTGERLVFVGGAPRSGTTLVQNHLDSHPDIAGGPEFDHVPRVLWLLSHLRRSAAAGRIDVFFEEGQPEVAIGLLLESLLLPYADRRGATLLSEKTPWNVLVFPGLLGAVPAARLVLCIRDPRAVVSSMLQVGERAAARGQRGPIFTRRIGSAVRCVQTCNAAGFDAARRAPDRVHVVRYESLVADPVGETRRICAFLGVDWDERMARPGAVAHDGARTLDGVWYTAEMYGGDPDPGRVDRWRRHLGDRQAGLIAAAFLGDRDLAYPMDRPGAADRIALALALAAAARPSRSTLVPWRRALRRWRHDIRTGGVPLPG